MFFDKFSSLYEIFAASNLASIVSNNFNKAIEEKVLVNYSTSREKNININSKVNIAQETAQSMINNPNAAVVKQENLDEILTDLGGLKEEYEDIDSRVQGTNFTESIKFIPILSAFGVFYSLSALITLGSCDSGIHSYIFWNSIGFVNFLCAILITWIANKSDLKISYPRLGLYFLIILGLGILFYILIPESWFFIHVGHEILSNTVVIESIFIPVLHYILFIVIGTIKAKHVNKSILEELNKFEVRFDKLLIRLNDADSFVKNIEKMIDLKSVSKPKDKKQPKQNK